MASTERIFINPNAVKMSSMTMKIQNLAMRNTLNDFSKEIQKLDLNWDALGAAEMVEAFEELKPQFEVFDNYVKKVTNFLDDNVAENVKSLDRAIAGNASQLKTR
ncbi:MAG: hypothetical protein J6A58_09680 [Oscillospiraceae bacterium]|nr:hypothetical protein [Oscillospiraceae bacterium]